MYKGKNILITGGSSGLGKYMALAYANKQGRIINLSRNLEKMKNLDSKLKALNGLENKYFSVDVSNYEDILSVKNQLWAKAAPLIILSVAKINFEINGKTNKHALHDVGAAVNNMTMQANSMGLYVRQMAGFDSKKAKVIFNIPDGYEPVAAIAIGYYGNPDELPEEFIKSEISERNRKPAAEFTFEGKWHNKFR